eukprot:scaffold2004_cov101-Cylindrotheca_fusiformis.AAC.7
MTSQTCYRLVEEWMLLAKKQNDKNAAIQCQQLVQVLESTCAGTSLEPTRHFYDLVLQALCGTGQTTTAQELLLRIATASVPSSSRRRSSSRSKRGWNKPKVSAKSFHIVMNGWAKAQNYNSGLRAEELYQQMGCMSQNDKHLKPNHRSLTALIDAWAKSGHEQSYDRIRDLLQQTLQNKQPSLDLVGFHTVLQALSSSSNRNNKRDPRRAAETCEHILNIMEQQQHQVQPNAQTYSLIIHAWAQCEAYEQQGRAAERAELLLHHMMKLHAEGVDVKPNKFTFTTCMAAWSRCHQPERAQALLQQLADLYERTQDPDLKPDTAAGNTVILAWSRSNRSDAVEKTKEALANLPSQPNIVSYNAMLHAYSRAGMFKEAMELVEQLEENDDETTLIPDVVSYNCLLNACAKSNTDMEMAGEKAEQVLARMKTLGLNPTSTSYTSVVQAHSRSLSSNPANAVYRVYQQALESEAELDDIFFVAILQAYAREREYKKEALNMAKEAFDHAVGTQKRTTSDLLSVAMLEACFQLTEESRNDPILVQVLDHSKKVGNVSRRLLATLRRCTKNDDQRVVAELLGHNTTHDMPESWSRAIPKRHRP